MSTHVIVCPGKQTIINSLSGKSIAPVLTCLEDVLETKHQVEQANASLHCVIVHSHLPLSLQNFTEDLKDIPIALFVESAGNIAEVIRQMQLLKQLNIRIYLPLNSEYNFSIIRILSSLGIETAASFNADVNWEKLADLMAYSFYGQVEHAPIAPFNYLAQHYNPRRRNDYSAVYFEDPTAYLHINQRGNVALTGKDLDTGNYLSESIYEIRDLNKMATFQNKINEWRQFFLKADGCAYCPSWRICLGKYASSDGATDGNFGCEEFFSELYAAIEKQTDKTTNTTHIWQP